MFNANAKRVRLGVECLEGRELMSWGAVPPATRPAGGDRWTVSRYGADGVFRHTAGITRGEVESYSFTARKTGLYTFQAKAAANSRIDTVMALYDSLGRLRTFDDDGGAVGTDSKMTFRLVGGQRYAVAVTNYNGTAYGSFNLSVAEPMLTAYASTDLGRISSSGDATLRGTTLTLHLNGQTMTSFDYTDHYIQVRILDANGRAIHNGYWQRGFRTAGDFVPGNPNRRERSWDINLSGWNLSRAASLEVTVGYH